MVKRSFKAAIGHWPLQEFAPATMWIPFVILYWYFVGYLGGCRSKLLQRQVRELSQCSDFLSLSLCLSLPCPSHQLRIITYLSAVNKAMKFLIIQTAFIGDVVLATPLIEQLRKYYPEAEIDFLLRKGNETLLTGHPHLRQVLILDKRNGKFKNLLSLIGIIRKEKYDYVINLQRFMASGIVTAFSGARHTIGFAKNPLSFMFSQAGHQHPFLRRIQATTR
jgi:hypothetical protein